MNKTVHLLKRKYSCILVYVNTAVYERKRVGQPQMDDVPAPLARNALESNLAGVDASAAPSHCLSAKTRAGTFAAAGICSAITFSWLNPLMNLGATRALQQQDLPPLDADDTCRELRQKLSLLWEQEEERAHPSLFRAVLRLSGWTNLARAPVYLVGSIVRVANALLLGALIRHVQESTAETRDGVWLAAGMVCCTLCCEWSSAVRGRRLHLLLTDNHPSPPQCCLLQTRSAMPCISFSRGARACGCA